MALAFLLIGGAGRAAAQAPPADSAATPHLFDTGQNPTVPLSQFQPYVEWNSLPDGVARWEIAPDGVYAFNAHLQVLGQLPFVVQTAGTAVGAESASGLGDLYIQPTYTFAFHRGSSRIRGLLAFGLSANTGDPTVGQGAWVFTPEVGVSIPVGKRTTFVTVVGYQASAWEDPGVESTENIITSEYLILHLPQYWYTILQVNPVYIVTDSRWTNVVTLQVGKFFGARHRVGPSVQWSFNSGTKTSVYPYSAQVQVAMNWLYPKGRAGH